MKSTPTLRVLIGCSASGKSTYAKNFVAKNDKWCIVSRDDIQYAWQNKGVVDNALESIITDLVAYQIESLIGRGYSVIYDATNLKAQYIQAITSIVKHTAKVEYQIFDVPKEVAIERDSKRERSVGKEVIEKQWKDYMVLLDSFDFNVISPTPNRYIYPIWDNSKRDAIIVDIDGTLAHTSGKRGWYDYDKVHLDDLDECVARIVNDLSNKYLVIIVTGRDVDCRSETEGWLDSKGVVWNFLFMRKSGDKRKDSIVKEEIFWSEIAERFNVVGVFDDRGQVVKCWRDLGLKCFQVDYGNF